MRTSLVILALLIGSANAATPVQRSTSILTGAIDAAPTAEQSNAVADAYVARLSDAQCVVCESMLGADERGKGDGVRHGHAPRDPQRCRPASAGSGRGCGSGGD